jgi:hypothetical protein
MPETASLRQSPTVYLEFSTYDASVQDVENQYREMAVQVMCKCVFESLRTGLETDIRFVGTQDECEKSRWLSHGTHRYSLRPESKIKK